jgi:hypothetical protein
MSSAIQVPVVRVVFDNREYVVRNGWDVFACRRVPGRAPHLARVPHTHTRILEGVRGDVSLNHIVTNPGQFS